MVELLRWIFKIDFVPQERVTFWSASKKCSISVWAYFCVKASHHISFLGWVYFSYNHVLTLRLVIY